MFLESLNRIEMRCNEKEFVKREKRVWVLSLNTIVTCVYAIATGIRKLWYVTRSRRRITIPPISNGGSDMYPIDRFLLL